MNSENIQYSINLIKLYKLSLKDLVRYIEEHFNQMSLERFKSDSELQNKLNMLKATIKHNFKNGKTVLVSLLDNTICYAINFKGGVAND